MGNYIWVLSKLLVIIEDKNVWDASPMLCRLVSLSHLNPGRGVTSCGVPYLEPSLEPHMNLITPRISARLTNISSLIIWTLTWFSDIRVSVRQVDISKGWLNLLVYVELEIMLKCNKPFNMCWAGKPRFSSKEDTSQRWVSFRHPTMALPKVLENFSQRILHSCTSVTVFIKMER